MTGFKLGFSSAFTHLDHNMTKVVVYCIWFEIIKIKFDQNHANPVVFILCKI